MPWGLRRIDNLGRGEHKAVRPAGGGGTAFVLCVYSRRAEAVFGQSFKQDTVSVNPKWVLSEPNSASTASLGKRGLLLDASGQNGGSDLWPSTNYNASLLLQPISPALDYTITTDIDFAPINNYMGAGIVLTTQTSGFTPSSVFHRFEYGDNPVEGLESFGNGTPDPNYVGYNAGRVFFRLQKSASTYSYSYSKDGKDWTLISTVTDAAPYTYVGLISIRQPYDGQTQLDSQPVFKYFKIKVGGLSRSPQTPRRLLGLVQ